MYIPAPITDLKQDQEVIDQVTNRIKPALPKPKKRHSKLTGRILKWDQEKVGRPTVMTDNVITKLELGASKNYNVSEMCLFANISLQTYYAYVKNNPSFSDRIDLLRHKVSIHAKARIDESINSDDEKLATDTAKWHLEKTEQEYQPVQRNLNVVQNLQDDNKPIGELINELITKYPLDPVKD